MARGVSHAKLPEGAKGAPQRRAATGIPSRSDNRVDGGQDQPHFIYPLLAKLRVGPWFRHPSPSLTRPRRSRSDDASSSTCSRSPFLAKPNPLSPALGWVSAYGLPDITAVRALYGLGSSSTARLHFGRLAVVLFHVYPCFSTVVSCTTRSRSRQPCPPQPCAPLPSSGGLPRGQPARPTSGLTREPTARVKRRM